MDTIERLLNPLLVFLGRLDSSGVKVLLGLILSATIFGYLFGRFRLLSATRRRLRGFQNQGERKVSREISAHFRPPDYHLMNHVTLPMDDGTTQVDHILVSRFGVFVIETKDFRGWIFGDVSSARWTQVLFKARFRFQNPINQNRRHVRAVRDVLDFVETNAIRSLVVFTGDAEFKTEIPEGVIMIGDLRHHLDRFAEEVLSLNHVHYALGRLEATRLAITDETDMEHVRSLRERYGDLPD